MAFGHIFNPLKLLRISPLILTTISFTYANTENIFYSAFLPPSHRKQSNSTLPHWFNTVLNRVLFPIIFTYSTTALLAGANIAMRPDQLEKAGPWCRTLYGVGLAGSLGHLAFVPLVKPVIERILRGEEAVEEMRRWLRIHRVRMLVTDLPAWGAYLVAGLMCLDVVR